MLELVYIIALAIKPFKSPKVADYLFINLEEILKRASLSNTKTKSEFSNS